MAEISIIVPVYNVEKYLTRCIDSILAQTVSDFELILVDDGSADRSGKICDEYAARDKRVHAIHQQNGGQAAAKNTGIAYAYAHGSGGWLAFIDSDDWVDGAYLQTLLEAAQKTGADISVCDLATTDGQAPSCAVPVAEAVCLTPEALWCTNRLAATVPVCKLINKNVFEGFFFPEKKVHEDELLLYQVLFSRKTAAYVASPLYYYFQNPNGVTLRSVWTPDRADSTDAFCAQCVFFRNNGYPKAEAVSAKALFISCAEVLNNLTELYPDEKKAIRRYRAVFRRTWRSYRAILDYSMVGSKKNYMRLAHPLLTKLRRKRKHLILSLGRLFHA